MTERNTDREYLIIPTEEELADAWQQYRGIVTRRMERGQVIAVGDGLGRVSGTVNADRILEGNPHIQEAISVVGDQVAIGIEKGHIAPEETFERGAKYILEMFSIATTAHEVMQIENDLDD